VRFFGRANTISARGRATAPFLPALLGFTTRRSPEYRLATMSCLPLGRPVRHHPPVVGYAVAGGCLPPPFPPHDRAARWSAAAPLASCTVSFRLGMFLVRSPRATSRTSSAEYLTSDRARGVAPHTVPQAAHVCLVRMRASSSSVGARRPLRVLCPCGAPADSRTA